MAVVCHEVPIDKGTSESSLLGALSFYNSHFCTFVPSLFYNSPSRFTTRHFVRKKKKGERREGKSSGVNSSSAHFHLSTRTYLCFSQCHFPFSLLFNLLSRKTSVPLALPTSRIVLIKRRTSLNWSCCQPTDPAQCYGLVGAR